MCALFPKLRGAHEAAKFWETYRHGLLHQATLKAADAVIEAAGNNAAPTIRCELENFSGKL